MPPAVPRPEPTALQAEPFTDDAGTGSPEWAPERTITPQVAARVVAEQFPSLAGLPVEPFDSGWDNILFRVGDDVVVRFVHRAIALRGAQVERAVLLALPDLPIATPRPVHLGIPTAEVEWPFWGAGLLPGRELAAADVPDDARSRIAREAGDFLHALHDPALAEHVVSALDREGLRLPVDPMRRGEPAPTAAKARGRLDALVAAGAWQADPAVTALLAEADAATAGSSGPGGTTRAVLVHGDLHVRHVLVAADERGVGATGIIDWGDTALADPSVDLALGFAAFVGPSRQVFLDAYGPVPPRRELAARVLAVHMCASLALYAVTEGLVALAHESLAALGRAVG